MIFEVTFVKFFLLIFLSLRCPRQRYILDCVVCFCILLPCRASIGQLDRSTSSMFWFLSLLLFDKVLEHFKRCPHQHQRRPLPLSVASSSICIDSCWAARSLSRSGAALASAREAISGGILFIPGHTSFIFKPQVFILCVLFQFQQARTNLTFIA